MRVLQEWKLPSVYKFGIVGYGAILFEEVIAAFTNNLSEGFSMSLFVIRIGQFWAFNVIVFTGFIWGWYILLRRYAFSNREVFWLAGLLGIYNEGIYKVLLSNPLAFVIFALPTIFVYGIILSPALFSLRERGTRTVFAPQKYVLVVVLIVLLSVPCFALMLFLRTHSPQLFPGCNFIPC